MNLPSCVYHCTYLHIPSLYRPVYIFIYTSVYTCIDICTYICIYLYIPLYIHLHILACTSVYICMYLFIYLCIYLTFHLPAWFGPLNCQSKNKLFRIVSMARKIVGKPQKPWTQHFKERTGKKERSIPLDSSRPISSQFEPLNSRRRYSPSGN